MSKSEEKSLNFGLSKIARVIATLIELHKLKRRLFSVIFGGRISDIYRCIDFLLLEFCTSYKSEWFIIFFINDQPAAKIIIRYASLFRV